MLCSFCIRSLDNISPTQFFNLKNNEMAFFFLVPQVHALVTKMKTMDCLVHLTSSEVILGCYKSMGSQPYLGLTALPPRVGSIPGKFVSLPAAYVQKILTFLIHFSIIFLQLHQEDLSPLIFALPPIASDLESVLMKMPNIEESNAF